MFDIYVISLSSSERRESIAKVLTDRGAAFRFEDAVDGRELTEAQIDDIYDEAAARDRYGRPLTRGELGCFMSHRSAWRKIAESGRSAVVIEDDALLEAVFYERVLTASEALLASAADIVLLGRSKLCRASAARTYLQEPLKRSRKIDGLIVGVPFKQWTSGSVAYWIAHDGARKALAHTEGAIGALLDDWPWHRSHGGLRVAELRPYAAWEAFETMQSSLESARSVYVRPRPASHRAAVWPLRHMRTAVRWMMVLAFTVTGSRGRMFES
ncbi:glycosyltransferase family 25 protein [Paraburkholderia sediminicola]|uniref:Glycosyltransferase family 25 protein n=1 Tax=Paraburkholderia rhynchosiae TaxID=487049 RepID=A0ACC7NDH7_9BURK